jgi:hypothetical protein
MAGTDISYNITVRCYVSDIFRRTLLNLTVQFSCVVLRIPNTCKQFFRSGLSEAFRRVCLTLSAKYINVSAD